MHKKSTTSNPVSSYIADLPDGTVFATRHLLHLARRSAVDTVLSRLTKAGQLHRLAHGVYMKNGNPNAVSEEQIVKVKCEAFGRQIRNYDPTEPADPGTHIYFTNGSPSAFKVRGKQIKLLARSPSSLMRAELP